MNNEKLATIQRVKNVRVHPNADSLDLCDILGWTCVIKHGEFKENELVVYISIDTILPEKPEFEFLRNKNFRIKPIKLRGQISNGIVFSTSIINDSIIIKEGMDVTSWINVQKYEKPIPTQLAGKIVGQRPSFIAKTDELNLRSYPQLVEAMKELPYYISRKDDGSSASYFLKNGEFGVCSRNLQLLKDETNSFWKMVDKYNIEKFLRDLFNYDICLQAELVGPGINKNRLGLIELELHAFNLIDLRNGMLQSSYQLTNFCGLTKIPMVTIIKEGESFDYELRELVSLTNAQKYPNGSFAEGIVVRPKVYTYNTMERMAWNALSGKIVSELYRDE